MKACEICNQPYDTVDPLCPVCREAVVRLVVLRNENPDLTSGAPVTQAVAVQAAQPAGFDWDTLKLKVARKFRALLLRAGASGGEEKAEPQRGRTGTVQTG